MYCSVPNWRMVRDMHINAVACGGQEWILDSLDLKLQPSNVVSRTQTQVLWESSPTWWTQWKASFQYMSTRAGYPTVVTKFSSTRHLEKIASLFAHKKAKENCFHLLSPISQVSSTRSRQFNTTIPSEASAPPGLLLSVWLEEVPQCS